MIDSAFVILCLLFAGALVGAEHYNAARLKWVAKPAASLCFVLFAANGASPAFYSLMIIAGLIACAAGDVFLLKDRQWAFLSGMGAFALGHIFYVAAFINSAAQAPIAALLPGIIVLAVVAFTIWRLWPALGAFRFPVLAYTGVISVMVILSFIAAPKGVAPYWPLIIGAIGFAVSDIAVARDRFATTEIANYYWGLPLYYGAQLLIASSV